MLIKHLWNVASRKESLWVKWINVIKLKNMSVWDITIDPKDSWGWKCLLNLRDVWHDKWNSEISLSSRISKRKIFYLGFKDSDSIADMINDQGAGNGLKAG